MSAQNDQAGDMWLRVRKLPGRSALFRAGDVREWVLVGSDLAVREVRGIDGVRLASVVFHVVRLAGGKILEISRHRTLEAARRAAIEQRGAT